MMRTAFRLLSPEGPKAVLTTLIFHRVLSQRDALLPDEVTAEEFDRICRWLAHWFQVLPLDEAVQRLSRGSLPARAACITFDDGYADNCATAMPILQRHGLCATFFVATGFLDGGRMWNDTVIEALRATQLPQLDLAEMGVGGLGEIATSNVAAKRQALPLVLAAIKHLSPTERQAAVRAFVELAGLADRNLPSDLMMQSTQVKALRHGGMQVGAHTVSHPILARLSDAQAREEIGASRDWLQRLLGEPVTLFAYPNGQPGIDYTARDVSLVRNLGFAAAVSTAWGVARIGADPYQLPRFTPWDRSRPAFGLRLVRSMSSRKKSALV